VKPFVTIDEPGTLLSPWAARAGSVCVGSAMPGATEATLIRRRVDGRIVLGAYVHVTVDLSSVKQPPIHVPQSPRERNP
jgi:hypothetical protein